MGQAKSICKTRSGYGIISRDFLANTEGRNPNQNMSLEVCYHLDIHSPADMSNHILAPSANKIIGI